MVEAAPASPFEVAEPSLLFEFLIIAFDAPAQFGGTAEQNSKHAIDLAQKLAHELRVAQQRISELEAEVAAYRNEAERAE